MDTTENELLRIVTRAYARAQIKEACCCGITESGCQILCSLGPSGSLPQAELTSRLGLEKSWVSRAIDGLEHEGLVERTKCCADGRMYNVNLTEAGEERYRRLNAALNEHARSVMSRIPKGERSGVRRSLELLAQALDEEVPPSGCCAERAVAKRDIGQGGEHD